MYIYTRLRAILEFADSKLSLVWSKSTCIRAKNMCLYISFTTYCTFCKQFSLFALTLNRERFHRKNRIHTLELSHLLFFFFFCFCILYIFFTFIFFLFCLFIIIFFINIKTSKIKKKKKSRELDFCYFPVIFIFLCVYFCFLFIYLFIARFYWWIKICGGNKIIL